VASWNWSQKKHICRKNVKDLRPVVDKYVRRMGCRKWDEEGARQPRRKENEKYYSVTIPQMCHKFLRCYISFFRSNVRTIQRPSKSVNRNSLLYHTSIYRHPRYTPTNFGRQTVALYRDSAAPVFIMAIALGQCLSTAGPREILLKLITNLNVTLYLSTCHTVYIIVLILFMIMP